MNLSETTMQSPDIEHLKLEPFAFYNCCGPTEVPIEQPSTNGAAESLEPLNPTYRRTSSENGEESDDGTNSPQVTHRPDNLDRSKPQSCKICGKVLSSSSSYYVHMKLHSGSKPYQCTICEASFCRKPYLEVHMRTHTGERPFQCKFCAKRFTQKSSLNTHTRVHTGERPYSCDVCNKRFAVKSYVTAHRWSHMLDKPLACERCKISFSSKNQFAMHLRLHTTSANFECHMCGRIFARDCFLIRHQNKVHRQGMDSCNAAEDDVDSPITEEDVLSPITILTTGT